MFSPLLFFQAFWILVVSLFSYFVFPGAWFDRIFLVFAAIAGLSLIRCVFDDSLRF